MICRRTKKLPVPGLETGNSDCAVTNSTSAVSGRSWCCGACGGAACGARFWQGQPAGAVAASCGTCSRRPGPGLGFVPVPAARAWPADVTSLARSDCRSDLPRLGRARRPPHRLLRPGLGSGKLRPDGSLRRAHRLLWTRQWTIRGCIAYHRRTGLPRLFTRALG